MTYEAFKKQADRSFFPGSTMPVPYTDRSSAAPTEGAIPATAEQIRSQEAWKEGFKEGLAGALKGDGFRGLARGALHETADTLDVIQNAPVRTAFIPPMLIGKGITYTTGNDKVEQGIRKTRNFLNNLINFSGHMVTGGMRHLAETKALDPEHLSQEAYDQSVLAGKGGIMAADLAISGKLPTKALNILAATEIPDAVTQGAAAVEPVVKELRSAARRQAGHNAMTEYFKNRTRTPAGPFIAHVPKLEKNFINDLAISEAAMEPEGSEILNRIEQDADTINTQRAIKELKQIAKQTAGAGAGGLIGLTAAHQITKRIPALKKRRILRYLLNAAAAGGLGYAGWKLTQRF